MPATTVGKGIELGWSTGESGWGEPMNRNLRRLEAWAFEQWAHNAAASSGLTYAYKGGIIVNASGAYEVKADGTVNLTANATNYVQRNELGVVSANTTSFSADHYPMAIVTTGASAITAVQDYRVPIWFSPRAFEEMGSLRILSRLHPRIFSGGNISGSDVVIDPLNGPEQEFVLTGNVSSLDLSAFTAGDYVEIWLTQGSGGPYTVTFPDTVIWDSDGPPPSLAPTVGNSDLIAIRKRGNGTLYGAHLLYNVPAS